MSQYDTFTQEYIAMRNKMFQRKMNAEFPVMIELLGDLSNKRLLDIGCGFGDYAKLYADKGAIVTAIDNSKNEIEYARKKNIQNVDFMVCDVEYGLPFEDSSLDVLTSSLVFDHLENLDYLFKECNRVLKSKGTMVFSITNPVFYQEGVLVGQIKILGKKVIFGDYFRRRKVFRKWGGKIRAEHYHKPLEDYFSAFLKNGFELLNFREPKPTSKEITWHCKNPAFLVFKLLNKIKTKKEKSGKNNIPA